MFDGDKVVNGGMGVDVVNRVDEIYVVDEVDSVDGVNRVDTADKNIFNFYLVKQHWLHGNTKHAYAQQAHQLFF